MWTQYRKTALFTQTFILLTCIILFVFVHVNVPAVLAIFAAMQIGAVFGAMWAVRLRNKVLAARERQPLGRL